MASDSPSPTGVHHIALQVRDLERMERFYAGLLGLPVLRRWPAATGAGDRAVWLELGAGAFLALEVVGGDVIDHAVDVAGAAGWFLVALRIRPEERHAQAERLAAAGHPVYASTAFTIYVKDPEGNRLGLSHHPEPAPDALRDV